MSIKLMTIAWESELPTGPKMVLLALADSSNDQGQCYPSVSTVMQKCSMSKRSVFNHLRDLERMGAVTRIERPGRSTVYQLDPCKFCTPANFAPLQNLHQPVQSLHPTRADSAPTRADSAPITVTEPTHFVRKEEIQKRERKPRPADIEKPDDVTPDAWDAYLTVRRTKKAGPMTNIALDGLRREAGKAGMTLDKAIRECVERGWQSLRADWLAPKQTNQGRSPRHAGAAAAVFEDATHV